MAKENDLRHSLRCQHYAAQNI